MNKRDLIDYVCEHLETTKSSSEEIVNVLLSGIQSGVSQDGSVSIAGFGTWTVRDRAARTGRNPQTGESIEIAASRTVAFKPAKAWKDQMNG
jgi:nucleoid DNA-binding protein